MLKIPKGLKKKKKGKKSKHKEEDDLFDSAELEKYRRDQQLKQEAAAAAAASEGEDQDKDKGEEWEKFKALTSGVDDILNKTKGDLDRIKSTSFFQKKPPGPSTSGSRGAAPASQVVKEEVRTEVVEKSKGRWVGFDENSVDEEHLESAQVQEEVKKEEPVKEEEEEESEFENDQDDIFDTSYVDAFASGEIKLVYVPDSPEKEEGDDPFDTSIVDKVIKPEIQKKALIGFTLGSAVEVLAGKADKPRSTPIPIEAVKPQRRRPRPQNLLLGSFDEGTAPPPDVQVEPEVIQKSILDEDPFFEEKTSEILGLPPVTPITDLTPVAPVVKSSAIKEDPTQSSKGLDLKDLVSEFEPSLATPSPVASTLVQPEDDFDDEFTELAKSSTQKSLPVASDELDFDEDDPFDTSFATKILPGKYELKIIENEVLSAEVSAPADPSQKLKEVLTNSELRSKAPARPKKPEFLNPAPLKKDLLGGSTSDLSRLGDIPIAPKSETESNDFDLEDPFDTSVVDKIVAPGKTELKFLEKELLDSSKTEDLDDFDPRAEERLTQKPPRPNSLVCSKRASIPKVVAFDVKSPSKLPDLLGADQDIGKVSKPLTPYYPAEVISPTSNSQSVDPFDTSLVSAAPGKYEVQLLEKELAEAPSTVAARKLSDPDFDPRFGEPDNKASADIISGEVDCNSKLHTPVVPSKAFDRDEESERGDDFDPFDTSIVSGLVLGRAEVKVLETELIHSTIPQPTVSISSATDELLKRSRQNSSESRISVTDVLEHTSADITVKPLTPALVSADSFEFDDGADPFDTSAVATILPEGIKMANPFLFTEEPVSSQNSGRGFNPFLSEGDANDNPFASSSPATNPFAFVQDSSQPAETSSFNYEDIFSSHVQPTATVVDDIFASDNPPQSVQENLFSPIVPEVDNMDDKPPPRRPPPPKPEPPKETKDLILSVTGAMEATSTDMLDRLQANRTPSPTPMRELHSPSPTHFGDLLDVDGGSSFTSQPPPAETNPDVNFLGDDFDFTTPVASQPPEETFIPEASLVSPQQPVAPIPTPVQQQPIETPAPPKPISPIATPSPPIDIPAAVPTRPAPPRVPERPRPPVQPPRPVPPQRIPTPEPIILDDVFDDKPTNGGVFESAFTSTSQFTNDMFSPPAAPPPTATFPPSPTPAHETPSPIINPPSGPLPPATVDDFDLVFTDSTAPVVPVQPVLDPFGSQPTAAPADKFDAFSAKFDSFGTSNTMAADPFGDAMAAPAAPCGGGAFDAFGSAFDAAPASDTGQGFGADDSFDAFLSLREPPPAPQGTPARVKRSESTESNEANEFNIFIKPKSAESAQLDNGPLPSLAPPPKSPSQANAFQDTSPRFNPFDNTQEPAPSAFENAFAQAISEDAQPPMERTDSQETPPTPLFDEDVSQPLEDFPRVNYTGPGWEMQLRQPNKKKITGQRFWKKVWIKLVYQGENPVLQLSNNKDDKDPFQELPLQPSYSVSDIGAQQYDQYGKIFTVKLQFIFYKERPGVRPGQVTKAERLTNKLSQFAAYAIQGDYQGCKEFGSDLKKLGLPVEHAPQISQLFKIGSQCFEDMKQFSMCVEEALFRLPAHRDRALNYKMEEVQLTVVDELHVEQNANGGVEKQIARVRLFFLGFLSGMPDVELGVNDLVRQGKEVVGRHDIIPVVTEEWIRLEGVDFHSCVQQDVYEKNMTIKFKPPDAMYIELMRFRVRPPRNRELPIQLKCVFIVTGNKVEIRSDMLVPGFTSRKLGQIPCEDVMVRIPIPECWIYQFRVEKHFRYGSVKSAHRRTGKVKGIERFLGGAIDNMEPSLMETTSGVAKYEHQHRSIVWRVPRLPKEGQGAYTTHNLVVRLQLTSYDQIPDELAKYCYLEFTMPATTVSHTTVRSVSITESDSDTPPEKYVRQLSRHEYRVEIEHTQGEGPIDYLAVTAAKPPPITEEPKVVAPPPPPESDSDSSG